jgi:hypothetical protein
MNPQNRLNDEHKGHPKNRGIISPAGGLPHFVSAILFKHNNEQAGPCSRWVTSQIIIPTGDNFFRLSADFGSESLPAQAGDRGGA